MTGKKIKMMARVYLIKYNMKQMKLAVFQSTAAKIHELRNK